MVQPINRRILVPVGTIGNYLIDATNQLYNARDQGYGNNSSQRQNLVGAGAKKDVKVEAKEGKGNFVLTGAVSHHNTKLVYFRKKDGKLALTWRVETDVRFNWLLRYVNAYHSDTIHNVVDYVSDLATYQVYLWTVNDRTKGGRTSLNDHWNTAASPFTWLSDGQNNYTTTRGNNATAQDNPTGGDDNESNYRPDSPRDTFVHPYGPSQSDPTSYKDASITQLFFAANKYHDLLYVLGFDEKGGNFQGNNNGKGEQGNDAVVLFSQDGSGTNNANVVVHQYTHGLSTHLTGGPSNSGCLNGLKSGGMGEGWSDFMATMSSGGPLPSVALPECPLRRAESHRGLYCPQWCLPALNHPGTGLVDHPEEHDESSTGNEEMLPTLPLGALSGWIVLYEV